MPNWFRYKDPHAIKTTFWQSGGWLLTEISLNTCLPYDRPKYVTSYVLKLTHTDVICITKWSRYV